MSSPENLGLEQDDHDRFASLEFEVVKAANGRFYVRPNKRWFNQTDWAVSQARAAIEGFTFNGQGDGVTYKKPTDGANEG